MLKQMRIDYTRHKRRGPIRKLGVRLLSSQGEETNKQESNWRFYIQDLGEGKSRGLDKRRRGQGGGSDSGRGAREELKTPAVRKNLSMRGLARKKTSGLSY